MLDSYRPGQSSSDELDLIKELHQSCERLRPNVYRLAAETQQNEEMLSKFEKLLQNNNNRNMFSEEVLQASDELSRVFDKYAAIIVKGIVPFRKISDEDSLLDLGSPNVTQSSLLLDNDNASSNIAVKTAPEMPQSDIDALCDIFSAPTLSPPLSLLDSNVLKPTTLQPTIPGTLP